MNAPRLLLAGSFAAASMLLACGAVLGFDDLTPLPSQSDGGGTDAPTTGDALVADGDPGDGATVDAPVDCMADLQVDAKHCGRCGHSCQGGTCLAGKCQALKLADGLGYPEGLVVDANDVFVAELDVNRILRIGKNAVGPCATAPLPAQCIVTADQANVFKPTGMGIDDTSIYWANTGSGFQHEIRACARTGCGGQAARNIAKLGVSALDHLFGKEVLPLALVVKDGQVFWPESSEGALRSAPVAGNGTVTTYLKGATFMPLAIAVDDSEIFFTDDTNQHQTQIASVPRTGAGPVKVIAATPARPFGITRSPVGNLYWSVPFQGEVGDGLVQSAPSSGIPNGGPAVGAIATNMVEPKALVADATNLYWVISGDSANPTGLVVYCPLAGCPADGPIVLATQQRFPYHITQDETSIYWSNEGVSSSSAYDGQIWKIAKP